VYTLTIHDHTNGQVTQREFKTTAEAWRFVADHYSIAEDAQQTDAALVEALGRASVSEYLGELRVRCAVPLDDLLHSTYTVTAGGLLTQRQRTILAMLKAGQKNATSVTQIASQVYPNYWTTSSRCRAARTHATTVALDRLTQVGYAYYTKSKGRTLVGKPEIDGYYLRKPPQGDVPAELEYDRDTTSVLARKPVNEERYMVAGSGNGTTTDRARAEKWAQRRSESLGRPVPVLVSQVQQSAWGVYTKDQGPEQ
jgi:hypothetical protein